jgi:hypothetical protein
MRLKAERGLRAVLARVGGVPPGLQESRIPVSSTGLMT